MPARISIVRLVHTYVARLFEAKASRRPTREIDPGMGGWPAIIDADGHSSAVVRIRDMQMRPERERTVRGSQAVRIEMFAVRCPVTLPIECRETFCPYAAFPCGMNPTRKFCIDRSDQRVCV